MAGKEYLQKGETKQPNKFVKYIVIGGSVVVLFLSPLAGIVLLGGEYLYFNRDKK